MKIAYTVLTLALCLAGPANGDILPPPQQVSAHVYAWIGPYGGPSRANQGFRMNMAFVVGKNAVSVLETGYTEAMAHEMLRHIRKISRAPVKYAVNSNSQPDRFMGNEVFRRAGARIIAHADEAARMDAQGGNYAMAIEATLGLPAGSVKPPRPPQERITQDKQLDLGGVRVRLRHFGAAHTPAPLVAHVPEDNVVYAGDILYAGRLLAVIPDGNVQSWIKTFDALKAFGDATFIPGHGVPAKLAQFVQPTRDYLTLLDTHMSKMVDEGVPLQEAVDSLDQSRFASLENFSELAGRNANIAYLEREAAAFK